MNDYTVGVVNVYDPTTGLASRPVATAAWDGADAHWAWVPREPGAEELRHVTIGECSDAEQVQWLSRYANDPTVVCAVEIVVTGVARERVSAVLEDTLIDVICEAA